MARSLKERYEARQLTQLRERAVVANKQLLSEQAAVKMLLEAMDQGDLDKVSAIVQKLENIKDAAGGDIQPLTNAIDQAQAELNKFTAGGPLVKAWTKLKGKVGIDNPIVKIATFANALERGFKQLPQILKNNGLDAASLKKFGDPSKMTLSNAIAQGARKKPDATADALKKTVPQKEADLNQRGPDAPEAGNSGPSTITSDEIEASHKADTDPKTQAKIKSIIAQFQKALSPGGVFGAFKKVPYVNSAELAQSLMNAHISTLISVANAVRSGTQTGEIAADMQGNIAGGGGDVGTAATDKSGEAAPSGQAATSAPPSSPTKPIGSTPTGQQPTTGPGEKRGGGASVSDEQVKDYAGSVAKRSGVDIGTVMKVLAIVNGKDKKLREGGIK